MRVCMCVCLCVCVCCVHACIKPVLVLPPAGSAAARSEDVICVMAESAKREEFNHIAHVKTPQVWEGGRDGEREGEREREEHRE